MPAARLALAVFLALAALASPASAAPTYTAMTSNTSEDIIAVEYQSDSRAWFTTSNGKIYRLAGGNWTQEHDQTGTTLYDIEFQPGAGQIGLAVGSGGKVLRSINGGDTWSTVVMPMSNGDNCGGAAIALGDVRKVAFGNANTVYLWGATNQVMKSTNAGELFSNFNDLGETCKVNYGSPVTSAFFVPGAASVTGYVMTESFGGVFFTANDFADAQNKGTKGPNGFTTSHKVAGDPANPNRQWAVAINEGGNGSHFNRTEDGWNNDLGWTEGNPDKRLRDSAQDIAFGGGTVLMVGNSGQIMNSIDGVNFFYVDDPANATTKWLSVGVAGAGSAIIGGAGGKLIRTATANSIPDVVKPTGTIVGPDTVIQGRATQFTAQAADEAGGSGIDPAGFNWSVAGLTNQTTNPATFTFPNPGTFTLRVAFRDLAGNPAEASKSVTVRAPTAADLPPATLPASARGITVKRAGRNLKITVKGTLLIPAGVNKASVCPKKNAMKIRIRKGKKTIKSGRASLSKSCSYSKTLLVSRKKVGKAKSLTVLVEFPGNSLVRRALRGYKKKV